MIIDWFRHMYFLTSLAKSLLELFDFYYSRNKESTKLLTAVVKVTIELPWLV